MIEPETKARIFAILPSKDAAKITGKIFGKLEASDTHIDIYMLSLLGNYGEIAVDGGVNIAEKVEKVSGHLLEENIIL